MSNQDASQTPQSEASGCGVLRFAFIHPSPLRCRIAELKFSDCVCPALDKAAPEVYDTDKKALPVNGSAQAIGYKRVLRTRHLAEWRVPRFTMMVIAQ